MPLTVVDQGLLSSTAQYTGFKNRIINGAMVIDQRNAGALVSAVGSPTYCLDRWRLNSSPQNKFTAQQSTTAPAGFKNSLVITSSSAYSVNASDIMLLNQSIEGFNTADLGWGTANAATVTLSFWVRSSLTGSFGGAFQNGAGDRSYPFTYTISAANTWEQKTITVAGDTSGTWATDNTAGIQVRWGLGVGSTYSGAAGSWSGSTYFSATGATSVVGTNGATFYITGVQLEKGSTATSFDYRPYTTELQLCQRYFQTYTQPPLRGVASSTSGAFRMGMVLPVVMRQAPVPVVGALPIYDGAVPTTVSSVQTSYTTATTAEFDFITTSAVLTAGRSVVVYQLGSASMTLSAEL